ncbi:CinA family protein [Microbacterium oleivorans]|uniref:CinA family protein n=1 Tax=Microbacterium TaxID=33882 RepID=UPI0020417EBF|nr:CinA family protein [Microbacterium oleivorans]MCM3695453.1 CinA family protein [Microbacterium oleivorans]
MRPRALADLVERIADAADRVGAVCAVAESLTSGRLAAQVGRGPSAQDWFAGGVVAYQVRVKEDVLGLAPGTDPCSPECAEQLARGVRALLRADVAVSTTGVGGPDPQDGHAPGTVYLGWATADAAGHQLLRFDGEPVEVIDQAVEAALNLLLSTLDDTRPGG